MPAIPLFRAKLSTGSQAGRYLLGRPEHPATGNQERAESLQTCQLAFRAQGQRKYYSVLLQVLLASTSRRQLCAGLFFGSHLFFPFFSPQFLVPMLPLGLFGG